MKPFKLFKNSCVITNAGLCLLGGAACFLWVAYSAYSSGAHGVAVFGLCGAVFACFHAYKALFIPVLPDFELSNYCLAGQADGTLRAAALCEGNKESISAEDALKHAQFLRRYLLREGCEFAKTEDELGLFNAACYLESVYVELKELRTKTRATEVNESYPPQRSACQ